MTNPRGHISFEGLGAEFATFYADGVTIVFDPTKRDNSAAVGKAAAPGGHGVAKLAADGDRVIGKVVLVEWDGKVNVQYRGFMYLPGGNGAVLTLGQPVVGAEDALGDPGYVRKADSSDPSEVGSAAGYIVDASDPTAVAVNM